MNRGIEAVNNLKEEINSFGGSLSFPERDDLEVAQTLIKFPNGYGISFVKGPASYGLEAGIIKHHKDEWHLCFDTPVTRDVLGHLEDKDIIPLCKSVSELTDWREQTSPETEMFSYRIMRLKLDQERNKSNIKSEV